MTTPGANAANAAPGAPAAAAPGSSAPAVGRALVLAPQRREDEEPELRPLDFKLMLRLFRYTRPHAAKRNTLFVLAITRALQLNCLPAVLTWTLTGPIAHKQPRQAALGAAAFLGLAILTQLTFRFRMKLALELGESIVHDLRNDLFRHLQSMRMDYYGRTKLGRIISRVTSDADAVRLGVQDVLFVSIVQTSQMAFAAAYMAFLNWRLFLVLLALAPVLYGLNYTFRRRLSRVYREIQESFSRVTSTIAESVGGIRVTQGFVRQDVNSELFDELIETHGENNMRATRTTGLFIPLLELNSQVFYAALLIVAGLLVFAPGARAGKEIDDLVKFFFQAGLFFGPIQMIGQLYTQAMQSMAGAERVFTVLDTKPDWTDPPDAPALPPIAGKVEFQKVDFCYVPGKPVLRNINFVAQPGQTVALVGHTGSGKTTIINLIAKFYLPTGGAVLIDGYNLSAVNTDSLHRQLGIVLQNNFLFTGTVVDNIRMGKPGATDQEVTEAARKLDVLDLIESMPEGFSTNVGERGGLMSLGQRQVLCFCRAMLADPRILILDEATSSVDTMTEARIQKALGVLLQGRTSFVVAHRLSTIRKADAILVIDRGYIVERGTHKQLLATGGVYAQLYRKFIRASEA